MSGTPANGNGRLRPAYNNSISLGNIISLVAMLLAAVAVYYQLEGDVRVLAAQVNDQDKRLVKVENRVGLGDRMIER